LNEKVAAPVKKTEINGLGNSLYPQRLALTSPTSGGRLVGKFRLRTTATDKCVFEIPYFHRDPEKTMNILKD
jgi:hypothetical protein